ncbi:MAG: gfo/Idh/MocA family oxidoreductase [Acidobacteria bacterium]|nr:MAG: gfo/Idh/MocA family oxidoreductase [Acidobacteriota bacterium]
MDRRKFMGTAAGAAGLMIISPRLVRGTAANSAVRVGLLGCGGRGGADATDLAETGSARVVALADLFEDQLQNAKKHFDGLAQSKGHAGVDRSQMFLGPKAYEQIAGSKEVDAIVITTPPYFHPQHLEAVVAAGKHVYCEKPVAVDVRGAKRVIETGKRAEGRLSLDVGFQIRNAPPFVELANRVHAGALGTIACGEAYYYGTTLDRPEWPNASPVERRIRNWVWDRVLSGDIIVEQNIHAIDVCNWMLQAHPVKAKGMGGRKVRTDPGDVYDHFNVVFCYPGDVHVTLNSTQFDKGWWDVNERFFGSKGVSESHYSGPCAIYGDDPWAWNGGNAPAQAQPAKFSAAGSFSDNLAQADSEKKKAFVESITSGNFHNQAAKGVESALTAMLGRTAAYSAREVTWDELLQSDEEWDAKIDLDKLA